MARIRFFNRVGKTRIIPIGSKILLLFVIVLLLSTFSTNFITITLAQRQTLSLNNTVMVQQLKELYTNASNQYQIYSFSGDKYNSILAMRSVAKSSFFYPDSVALGVTKDGKIDFLACNNNDLYWSKFVDVDALEKLNQDAENGITEGTISFKTLGGEYSGVYKYHEDWNCYLIRAENRADLEKNSRQIYVYISILIVIFTIIFLVIAWIIIRKEFQPLNKYTNELIAMQKKNQLNLIDLSDAQNDDVSYMAASFNNLSSSVNNLLGTFQKFVSKDVVSKAYSEQGIALEGSQQELTMLFSDIKSFTYRTETLGNDIIDVLNVHYSGVIRKVHESNGVICSIIGDAILAIFGKLESQKIKSLDAVEAAWNITRETAALRQFMITKREELEKTRKLNSAEEKVFEAVLLDVGVGIDGGTVFYGNIGSNEHMANTVIGDNVNSASRLEGLTRIYHLPVIVSEYVKNEVEKQSKRYKFYEIDTVQVKGKTQGKKIFYPFDTQDVDSKYMPSYEIFEQGLACYYEGDWKSARKYFKQSALPVTDLFLDRMGRANPPENWSGIWTMTTK